MSGGSIPRLRNGRRCRSELQPRSGWITRGHCSAWPRNPRIGGIALIGGADCLTSSTFAPIGIVASGMPLASLTKR